MRALSASVVLSTMVLGGCLTVAKAQDLDLDNPPSMNSEFGGQPYDSDTLPPGHIPQPSLENPGLVTGVTLGQLYTDNLRLARSDGSKQSGLITQVQPFVKGASSGPRFSGMFDYALNGYLYEKPSGHNQLAQNLDARGTFTILPQHFFLDGAVSYGQQIINNQLPSGGGTFFLTNNRANVGIATLSPYWLQDLGRVGTMSLRYTHGRVVYNDRGLGSENGSLLSGIPDVTLDSAQFNMQSPQYQTWGWNLSYSEERVTPDFGPSWDFAIAKLGGSVQVNDSLRLLVDGGKENKFLPDGTVEKLGSTFWEAGFQWVTSRDNVKFMVGHRFFGRSYQLSWTHQAALLTTNVSYVERPTTYNQQLMGMDFGSGGLPPVNVRPDIPSLLERQPYLMKRLSASALYTMPKSRLSLRVYDELRTYFEDSDRRERAASADLSWMFDLGPFTTMTPSVRWLRRQFRDGQTTNGHYAQLTLVHQLDTKNFGSIRVRHDNRGVTSAALGAHGYTVNVIFVQWTHLF
ncbi:MAG TPA: TIGR03016 family PEP-CTERM system-associated outer membrane protein [Rhodanobacteraceae bacterium]|jgi:hypothetical protein|nr:TIGR03016 family PEP-CTERM system-associated outer membrane protein [Rhodanobacteraceae bacterium]